MLFKFKKQNGQEVMVNDESVEAALSLGWIEIKEQVSKQQTKAVKRGNSRNNNK